MALRLLTKKELPLQEQDLEQLKFHAHSIKGSGGSAGFPIIMEKSAALEHLIVQQDMDQIQVAVDELCNLCQRATVEAEK